MQNRDITILTVEIDDKIFELDYSFSNVTKIWEMLSDKAISPFIVPNLTMCMLSHSDYFKDYPLDKITKLLKKYWIERVDMLAKGFNSVPTIKVYQFEKIINRGGD